MVRTLLGEWACARPFADTADRMALLPQFLDFHNHRRPHWSLSGQPPISRVPVNDPTGKNSLSKCRACPITSHRNGLIRAVARAPCRAR